MTIDYGSLARIRRNDLGLTQGQVAEMACCHRETVVCFERNTRQVRFDMVLSIFQALGLKLVVEEEEGDDNKFRNDSTSPKRKTGLIEA